MLIRQSQDKLTRPTANQAGSLPGTGQQRWPESHFQTPLLS